MANAETLTFQGYPEEIINKNISIIPSNTMSINILSQFDYTLTRTDIGNETQTKTLSISTKIPKYITSGTYNAGNLIIIEKVSNTTHIREIGMKLNILTLENYSLDIEDVYNVDAGSEGYIIFYINNTGNTKITPTINLNSNIITINNSLIPDVYPGFSQPISVYYKVADNQIGEQIVKVTILGKENNFIFNIKDSTPPTVSVSADFDHIYGEKFQVCFDVMDNIGISEMTVKFGNESRINILQKDCKDFTAKELGDVYLQVSVEDLAGNENNKSFRFKIQKIGNIKIEDDAEVSQINKGATIEKKIISSPTEVEVEIELLNLKCREDLSNETECVRFKIITDKFEKRVRSGTPEKFSFKDDVKILIEGVEYGDYEAQFALRFPYFVDIKDNTTIEINGMVGIYTVAEDWKGKIWQHDVECIAIDNGVYKQSKYSCTIDYPIDTSIDKLTVPVTKSEESNIEDKCKLEKQALNSYIGELSAQRLIFLAIILIIIIAGGYILVVHPSLDLTDI